MLEEQLYDAFKKYDFIPNKRHVHQAFQRLILKIIAEVSSRDLWSSKIYMLAIPKFSEKLALR
nr:hypothetical protein [Candidatus Erwinia haradaeae]